MELKPIRRDPRFTAMDRIVGILATRPEGLSPGEIEELLPRDLARFTDWALRSLINIVTVDGWYFAYEKDGLYYPSSEVLETIGEGGGNGS